MGTEHIEAFQPSTEAEVLIWREGRDVGALHVADIMAQGLDVEAALRTVVANQAPEDPYIETLAANPVFLRGVADGIAMKRVGVLR